MRYLSRSTILYAVKTRSDIFLWQTLLLFIQNQNWYFLYIKHLFCSTKTRIDIFSIKMFTFTNIISDLLFCLIKWFSLHNQNQIMMVVVGHWWCQWSTLGGAGESWRWWWRTGGVAGEMWWRAGGMVWVIGSFIKNA